MGYVRQQAITTQAGLATALGCKQPQVSGYIRRKDWPFGKGPWKPSQVPVIQRWRADNLKQGAPEKPKPGDTRTSKLREEKLDAEVRKLRAQADEAETALARERGKLVPVEEVKAEWSRIGQRIRNELQNLAGSIVPDALTLGMPMTAAGEFQAKCEARILGVLRAMSDAGRAEEDEENV